VSSKPPQVEKTFTRTAALFLTALFISALLIATGIAGISAGAKVGTPNPPQPVSTPDPNEITFHNNTMADFSATSGEPIIKVDPKDQIFVTTPFGLSTTLSLLWRSSDGGRSYVPLGGPAPRDAVLGPGGGDTDVDFDDKGRLYYVDLSAACVTAAVSEDGGNTFPADRTNHITCVSDTNPGAATDDRQWIVGFGDGIAYATWRNFQGSSFWMFKTKDAGRTWDKGRQLGTVTQSGPLRIDKTKRRVMVGDVEKDAVFVYQVYYSGNNIRMFRVTDIEGQNPIVEDFSIFSGASDVSNVFPVLAVGRDGNLYAAWSQAGGAAGTSHTIWMATSTNRGQTWSSPKQVSTFTGTNIMPWIVAGDAGRASIVWYRGSLPNNPNNPTNTWQIYMAQTLNAFDSNPGFATVPVSQNLVHRGEICTAGLECDATGRDRSFLEYPSIWLDSKGAAVVVYNDNTNQSEGPYVMTAKQRSGPSLFASVGLLPAEAGAVSVAQLGSGGNVTAETLTLEGTHTVPAKNFDRDEAGDARPNPTAAYQAGGDLRSVSLKEDGDSLVLNMQVANLTPAAITSAGASALNGDGMLYLTQWDYNDQVYWLGAEIRAGRTSFYTGTLGMIRSATSKKFVTYNPDLMKSQTVTGQLQGTAPGAMTIRVPKIAVGSPPVGVQFHTVTGYALSERGPLVPLGADSPNGPSPAPKTTSLTADPTSLPLLLDASGAATYTTGDGGPITDGLVEISFDDTNFTAPRSATFSLSDSRWTLALGAADLAALAPGTHTVYVRQRINGRTLSEVASTTFSLSANVERLVTSMTSLAARNASSAGGTSAYDLLINNTSSQTIFNPLGLRVARISSTANNVTVANSDNAQTGAGAFFNYAAATGNDAALTAGEMSGARRLRFNNPNNSAFTVDFEVLGSLPRGVEGGSAPAAGGSSGSGGGSPGAGTSSNSSPVGAVVTSILRVTYNPLLGSATVEVLRP
jgi:hypothetical protein